MSAKEEFEIKSEEVLNILEKYREKLRLERYYLKFEDNFIKKYKLRIIFKCDYKKYEFQTVQDGEITIDFTDGKNIVKIGNWSSGSGIVFDNFTKFKIMIKMVEELQKIDYLSLNEFREYVNLKDKQKELEEQKEKLEEELLKKKEEIEKQLKELGEENE